uniref:Reverse transcriptase domain-containing protein n=1 Tax=Cuerna arida TaxID=1464854 RepID=A0A1B6FWX9_9HEMI
MALLLADHPPVKDLEVTVTLILSHGSHINTIIKKASSALGFIVRVSRDGFSSNAVRTLYMQLVHPHLEYCSVVWSPSRKGHIDLLEVIQRKFLCIIGVRFGCRYKKAGKPGSI